MTEKTIELTALNYDPLTLEAPATAKDAYLYRDSYIRFLRLRVTNRTRIWRWHGDRGVHRTIGDAAVIGLMDARLKASEWSKQLIDGSLPPTVTDQKRTEWKIERVFQEYFENHLLQSSRTAQEIMREFERHWAPIRSKRARGLNGPEIYAWIRKMPGSVADKQLRCLKSMFNWAMDCGLVQRPTNPCVGIKSGYESNEKLNYLKPGDEFARLSAALELESADVRDSVFLLLWTCQRKSNVLGMRWDEIDWRSNLWTIPPTKTKTRRLYHVALTPNALQILNARKATAEAGEEFVFPCVRQSSTRHLKCINKAWLRIRENAGLGKLRLHDLRHTGATWLALNGANAHTIQKALNHASVRTSEKYCHLQADDVREALDQAQVSMARLTGPLPTLTHAAGRANLKVIKGYTRSRTGVVVNGYVRKKAAPAVRRTITRDTGFKMYQLKTRESEHQEEHLTLNV